MAYRGLGTVVLAAIALLALVACSGEAEEVSGFYAEISVEVEASPDDPLAQIGPDTGPSMIRWWHSDDPQRWRWEIETAGASIDAGTLVTVMDGESIWEYDDRSRTYSKREALDIPDEAVLSPTFSAPVGPANASDIEAFMEQWRQRGTDTDVRHAGEDSVLGRRVEVVEIRPAWHSSSGSSSAPAPGSPTATPSAGTAETSGGVVRVAIDPERMFIMRWDVDGEGGGQSYHAEIVGLDYGTSIEASRFDFNLPEGAKEIDTDSGDCSGSGSVGGRSVSAPAGFIGPRYMPARFEIVGSSSESRQGCDAAAWTLRAESDEGYVVLHERIRHTLPDALLAWDTVALDGRDGYRESEGGVGRLVWQQDGVAMMLESDALPLEELIEIANSMQSPGGARG